MNSIKKRDVLYQQVLMNPQNQDIKEQYRTYRNKINSLIKEQKRDYFQNKIQLNRNNSKELWKITSDILKPKQSQDDINEIRLQNGEITNNNKKIVNECNTFFSNVGENMARNIKKPNTIYNNKCMTNVDYTEIYGYIRELKKGKAPGHDNITAELFIEIIDIITPLMVHLINSIFKQEYVQNILKSHT